MSKISKLNVIENMSTLKNEFDNTNNLYLKYIIIRLGIIISIILALISSINNLDNNGIINHIETIKKLSAISNTIPYSKDIFIQFLYLRPLTDKDNKPLSKPMIRDLAIDTNEFALYYHLFLTDSINDNMSKQAHVTSNDSIQYKLIKDSLYFVVENALNKQIKIVKEIETESDKQFRINFSFIEGTFDLRFWILLIPILYVLSEIYFFLLGIKMKILTYYICRHFKNEPLYTINFIRQPYLFLKNIIRLFEILLLVIFLRTIIIFFNSNDHSNVVIYLIFISVLSYYAIIFANLYAIKINPNEPALKYRKKLFINLFYWFERLIHIFYSKLNKLFSLSFGSVLVIITLFTIITTDGCDNNVRGYEFFSSYKPLHFYLGGEDPTSNIFIGAFTSSHAYLLSILISIISLILLISTLISHKIKLNSINLYRWLLFISGSCFFVFSFVFSFVGEILLQSIPFADLALVLTWVQFIIKKDQLLQKEIWLIEKIKLIAISWPLIINNIWYFIVILNNEFNGQPILYFGLLFLTVGLYKYSNTKHLI